MSAFPYFVVGFILLLFLIKPFVLPGMNRRFREKVMGKWEEVAKKYGGQFGPGSPDDEDWWRDMNLGAVVDGVDVRVTMVGVGSDAEFAGLGVVVEHENRYLNMVATARAPKGAVLSIATLGPEVLRGADNVDTGDARFDAAFAIRCRNKAFARAWLHEEVRERLLNAPHFVHVLRKGSAAAMCTKPGVDLGDEVEPGMLAVVAFADGRAEVTARFDELAQSLGGKLGTRKRGWPHVRARVGGYQVKVGAGRENGEEFTRITLAMSKMGVAPLVLALPDEHVETALSAAGVDVAGYRCWCQKSSTATQLARDLAGKLASANACQVWVDDASVRVHQATLNVSVKAMQRGVELAVAIAEQTLSHDGAPSAEGSTRE